MSLKKLALATVLIGGGVAAATSTSTFDDLFSTAPQEETTALEQTDTEQREVGTSTVSHEEPSMKSGKVDVATNADERSRDTDEGKPETVELDGKWRVIRALRDGTPVPFDRFGTMTVEFDAGKMIIRSGAKEEIGMLSAKQVSMIGETSFAEVEISPMNKEGDRKDIRGFYYLEEGELTFIWGAPGAERPDPTDREDFASARILTLEIAQ